MMMPHVSRAISSLSVAAAWRFPVDIGDIDARDHRVRLVPLAFQNHGSIPEHNAPSLSLSLGTGSSSISRLALAAE